MNSQKSLLAKIIETIDQHRAERGTVAAPEEQRASNLPRLVRWFLPNGGTLLIVLLLIATPIRLVTAFALTKRHLH